MKSILDPSFKYVNSLKTDIRKTFARVRRERMKEHQVARRIDNVSNAPRALLRSAA